MRPSGITPRPHARPVTPKELPRVLLFVGLLLILVAGFLFAVFRLRLVCLAVPCDTIVTVSGSVATPTGAPVEGCSLTVATQPGAEILPGTSSPDPLETTEVPSIFEESLHLTPLADRYTIQIVHCPGGAASEPILLDLTLIGPVAHDLGRIVVRPPG